MEHSISRVTIEIESQQIQSTREDDLYATAAIKMLQNIQSDSFVQIELAQLYSDLAASGNDFGPSF